MLTLLAWLSLALLLPALVPAAADVSAPLRGVALVIGQSDYRGLPKLANAAGDARRIEALLSSLGFKTDIATDRNARQFRRDLQGFEDDAEGAGVALLYYAGHGIEAGGVNYLVPVDATLDSLKDAGSGLIDVPAILDDLRSKAKITIVLLDACRSDPFPPGAMLAAKPGAPPQTITQTGLGATRGAVEAAAAGQPSDSLGEVIGFSAAPGQAALDGPAGTGSPYAAALLRHLDAGGLEFGQVMTLVSEEVYLATRGEQQPWTNTSLRRLLSFGGTPPAEPGDEQAITGERRQLLLTIATTPDELKHTVESVAKADKLPLDAIYGMLRLLQANPAAADPEDLTRQLRSGTARLKQVLAEQNALSSSDPELARLTGLADKAISEGALGVATEFQERAKARVAVLEDSVGKAEAEVKARRLEFAQVFARSARTHELAFDFRAAAADWAKAFDQAEKWDVPRAKAYRYARALALASLGEFRGDDAALNEAIATYGKVLEATPRDTDGETWAALQNSLGNAHQSLGERHGDRAELALAIAAFRAALEVRSRTSLPAQWAETQNNLGNALQALGLNAHDTAELQQAVAAYRAALEVRTRQDAPLDWALTENNLGTALETLGERDAASDSLGDAIAAYRAALEVWDRHSLPLDWAMAQNNLGNALSAIGTRQGDPQKLRDAVAAYRSALEEWTRQRTPLDWARAQNNLGGALRRLAEYSSGSEELTQAIAAFRAALEEWTPERAPLDWATAQNNLGNALAGLAERGGGGQNLADAITAYRAALTQWTRQRAPLDWAATENNLGVALKALALQRQDTGLLQQAVEAFRAALAEWTRERVPLNWASAQNNLGTALLVLGRWQDGTENLDAAVAAFRAALEETTRDRAPRDWAKMQSNLGAALNALGEREAGTQHLEQAAAAYGLALQELTHDKSPQQWAAVENNLANTLTTLGERQTGTAVLERAVDAYRAALQERTQERQPVDWAMSQDGLGWALKLLGERSRNKALVQDGRAAVAAAWQTLKAQGYDFDSVFADRLKAFDDSLKAMP